jgi:hypothetical protein
VGGVEAFCNLLEPGQETDPRYRIEHPSVVVCMSRPSDDPHGHAEKGIFSVIQEMLDSIIHEQLHAIFFLHGCVCDDGCQQRFEYDGESFHGVEFLAAALAIEQEASRILGWDVDLDRNNGLAADVHYHGYRLPNDVVLRRLDLDLNELLSTMRYYRESEVEKERENRGRLPSKRNTCLRGVSTVDGWENEFLHDEWLLR